MSYPFADVSSSPLTELLSLSGRRAVVTGGAQGLGRAIAERLAEAGAAVAIADLDAQKASDAAAAVAERHDSAAIGVRMDVADSDSVHAAAEIVASELGGVDI